MTTKPTALEQYHALVEEATRRADVVRALPVGSSERRAALAELSKWRNEVLRPTDARLWPLVVAEGAGHDVSLPPARSCPNPECRGGFVGGEDPHACGQC